MFPGMLQGLISMHVHHIWDKNLVDLISEIEAFLVRSGRRCFAGVFHHCYVSIIAKTFTSQNGFDLKIGEVSVLRFDGGEPCSGMNVDVLGWIVQCDGGPHPAAEDVHLFAKSSEVVVHIVHVSVSGSLGGVVKGTCIKDRD